MSADCSREYGLLDSEDDTESWRERFVPIM
jgi:hypothetical protein